MTSFTRSRVERVVRFRPFVVRIALVAALVLQGHRAVADSVARIGYDGFGQVRFGMSLWALLTVLGEHVTVEGVECGCTSVYRTRSTGPVFMVVGDRLVRIEVRSAGLQTISGVGVGDTEEDVYTAYAGRVAVDDHEYEEGHYLAVYSSDRKSALVFDTDGSRVRSFRIGRLPEALYVEGCS